MALISTRYMEMPRSLSAMRFVRTAHLRRSQAPRSPTTVRRVWRDSDFARRVRVDPVQSSGPAKNLSQRMRDSFSAKQLNCGAARATRKATKSRGLFNRGQAMLGASRAGHRHISIDQLVEADVRRDISTRSHRRFEFFSYV